MFVTQLAPANGKKTIVVAIDGPAGSGKSSVAKAAAAQLRFGMLDTGAAYRALTHQLLASGADLDDEEQVLAAFAQLQLRLPLVRDGQVMCADVDVTDLIRTPEVGRNVSRVAKHQRVRAALNAYFRQVIDECQLAGVIIEGRDITTVVAPYAQVRLILTADPRVRAQRRHKEMPELTLEQVAADLAARDAKDLQVVNFIDPAPGVQLLDTSDLDFAGAVAAVVQAVMRAKQVELEAEEVKDHD